MATGPVVNQGKTAFLEEFLTGHRDAGLDEVNEAWQGSGHEGTLSESLLQKVRARLGLTGRSGEAKSAKDRPGKVRPRAKVGRPAKAEGTARASKNGAGHSGTTPEAPSSRDEDDVVDELEEGIDELIHRLREIGGRPEVVKALRRARRLLVRGADA